MNLAEYYNLQPADVFITPKSEFRVVQHFVVFECTDVNGTDWYLENKQGYGVRRINGATFQSENTIIDVKRFSGNNFQRSSAIQRAQSLIGRPYNLINFNCEHYASYAQTGRATSNQVENWFAGAMILAGIVSLVAIATNASGKGRK